MLLASAQGMCADQKNIKSYHLSRVYLLNSHRITPHSQIDAYPKWSVKTEGPKASYHIIQQFNLGLGIA